MKETIKTSTAPGAIGPYSQAVKISCGEMIFIAGQVPLDPATGQMVQGDIKVQTRRVMENIRNVLAAAGANLDDVVKTTVFMCNLGEFQVMNEVYGEYFASNPPARSTVEVKALPRGAQVEIEAVAILAR